jgi:uncharacterized protein (TIGR03067 family)
MSRIAAALIGLFVLTAFAPAPFRRPAKPARLDLDSFQGKWKVVDFQVVESKAECRRLTPAFTHIRVRGDRWTQFNETQENSTFRLDIAADWPAAIDFYFPEAGVKRPCWVGLMRRDRERIQILYFAAEARKRPKRFEDPPANWWLLTLERTP